MTATFRLFDVLGKSVAVCRRRFLPFVVLAIIASIPEYVATFAIDLPQQGRIDPSGAARAGLNLVGFVTGSLVSGAVMYGVVQELRGRAFALGDSIRIALGRLLPLVGIAICYGISVGVGVVLLVVPGAIWACMFYVSMPACVVERTGVFDSMSRSSFLTKGYRWQVFGTVVLIYVVGAIFAMALRAALASTGRTGVLISGEVVRTIVSAFGGIVAGVFYYQLRAAKEGIDLDRIASVFE